MALIKEAYETLAAPDARATYDAQLRAAAAQERSSTGPRPAQVVSLEDFVEVRAPTLNADAERSVVYHSSPPLMHDEDEVSYYWYACRCGGQYRITPEEMEADQHLVGCTGCSEVVWAGYEVCEDEEDSSDE
ncbi:hypothetical protein HGRIS_008517 [Hohenbuehelia grisea]|uniref:DPH-type MB domain-containing protein n=1 Tax=Hohenbuehelia grisea TaxID=104357 RepID=A0ABR3J8M3_9AGAR